MDFKFGLLVFSAIAGTALSASVPIPSCVCTRNYKPICGSDGNTYANDCLLKCARDTSKSDLTIVRQGPCNIGPLPCTICPLIYAPVCGTDGVTYSNYCALECTMSRNSAVQLRSEGPCPTVPESPCICGKEAKQVCGSDGNTYLNSCELNCATMKNSMLSISHSGPCSDKVIVVDTAELTDKLKVVNNNY